MIKRYQAATKISSLFKNITAVMKTLFITQDIQARIGSLIPFQNISDSNENFFHCQYHTRAQRKLDSFSKAYQATKTFLFYKGMSHYNENITSFRRHIGLQRKHHSFTKTYQTVTKPSLCVRVCKVSKITLRRYKHKHYAQSLRALG